MSLGYFSTKACNYVKSLAADESVNLANPLLASLGTDKNRCRLLLQFPPSFTVKHLSDLEDYLHMLPRGHRYVVEVRNKSLLTPDFYAVLRENQVALAWADSPLMTEIVEVTADFLYVRWEGDRKVVSGTFGKMEVDRSEDLKVWAEKLKLYLHEDIDVFGYFGKYFSGYPPCDINCLSVFLD